MGSFFSPQEVSLSACISLGRLWPPSLGFHLSMSIVVGIVTMLVSVASCSLLFPDEEREKIHLQQS